MEQIKVYLGSSLFSASEQFWNEVVADELRKEGFKVFNPQSDNTANDKDNPNVEVSARSIFDGDTHEVVTSNVVIANLDGLAIDPGLAAECGIFWQLCQMPMHNPHYLGIIGYRSDIRKYGEGDQRFYFNQYVIGMIEDVGKVVDLNPPQNKLDVEAYRVEARKIVEAVKKLVEGV